jgi:pilus assembly protein CpaF
MAGFDLPHRAIREQIASAVDLIVHQERMPDGARKVTRVAEVQGLEQQTIVMQDVFALQQAGDFSGRVSGQLKATGIRPKLLKKLERRGIHLPVELFQGAADTGPADAGRRA